MTGQSGRFATLPLQGDGSSISRPVATVTAEKRTVHLTSFWKAKELSVPAYSIASKQPRDFTLPELEFFQPLNRDGVTLLEKSPRFKESYDFTLRRNSQAIVDWLEDLTEDVAIVCWCKDRPYKLTRCTRVLVGNLIKRIRPDIEIKLDIETPAWRT